MLQCSYMYMYMHMYMYMYMYSVMSKYTWSPTPGSLLPLGHDTAALLSG